MEHEPQKPEEFAPVVLKLLKGPLYYDDPAWTLLLIHQRKIGEYFGRTGLRLNVSEPDGYAYVSQPDTGDGEDELPRLIPRRGLSFEASLLCVILREEVERFDPEKSDSGKVFLSLSQIRERIAVYFKERSDEIRLARELDRYVSSIERLGYLRKVAAERQSSESVYEVMPIIKARVTPEFIQELKEKLEDHGAAIP